MILLLILFDNITVTCTNLAPSKAQLQTYDIPLFRTSEGLIIKSSVGTSLTTSTEFLLADNDYEQRSTFRLYDHISEHLCMQFLTTIRANSRYIDTYVRLEDSDGDTFVVYANNGNDGNEFIPTCINTNTIYVMDNFNNCYEDLPVTVSFMNRNLVPFLQQI